MPSQLVGSERALLDPFVALPADGISPREQRDLMSQPFFSLAKGRRTAPILYETGGIRSVEIGTVMFGRRPDGSETPAAMDLVRMAIPRRTYTQSHIDYVIEVVLAVAKNATGLRGYRIVDEPPQLRHFTARFEQLPAATR